MSAENPKSTSDAALRLAAIRARMDVASGGRDAVLVAVSKTFGAADIVPLIDAGQRIFGENRVQEAQGKWPALKAQTPDIELHLIGPLQTNKLKAALALFDVIHTLDRESLAKALVAEREKGAVLPALFIQVNLGREAQKAGIEPEAADAFISHCRDDLSLPVIGLMCIPPADDNPVPYFQALSAMAARQGLTKLSMGMSADFEAALRAGATHVRIGSALFGTR
ncbi:MAG: YggS family pyridoxal phosphate-dependent enzyme [Parvibaculum sp.]|nr:YggS family pyridoxal phosphate-dependent enzyme [Parvibaculum sp.]